MKTIIALALIVCTAAFTSCSSTSQQTTAIVAKADKAAADAVSIIKTAQISGAIKATDAEKLSAEIEKGRALVASTGKLDFTDARVFAASLAASGALPPNYAMGIQGALLVTDLLRSKLSQ